MPRPPLPPLGLLILGAFGLLRQKLIPVMLGVLCFTMLFAVGSAYLDRSVDQVLLTLADQTGLTADEVQASIETELETIMESGSAQGDSGAVLGSSDRLNALLLRASAEQEELSAGMQVTVNRDSVLSSYLACIGATAFGVFVFYAVILFFSMLFFSLLFVLGRSSASSVVIRLPLMIVPAFGVLFLLFLRSFIWVPFLGLPLAIYFLPRLSLAPVILLSGEAGVFGSVALSLKRTKGLWFPLFLRFLGGFLLLLSIGWFVILIAGSVMLFSAKIGFLLWLCGLVFMIAVAMAFLTVVAVTVG